jgi:hypothetical protein
MRLSTFPLRQAKDLQWEILYHLFFFCLQWRLGIQYLWDGSQAEGDGDC